MPAQQQQIGTFVDDRTRRRGGSSGRAYARDAVCDAGTAAPESLGFARRGEEDDRAHTSTGDDVFQLFDRHGDRTVAEDAAAGVGHQQVVFDADAAEIEIAAAQQVVVDDPAGTCLRLRTWSTSAGMK